MSDNTIKGLLSVPLGKGETANSFASRLAVRNGSARLLEFCTDMGVSSFYLGRGDPDTLRAFAELAGVEYECLLAHTPRMLDRNLFGFGAEVIKWRALQRNRLRYCPACLAEDRKLNGALGPYQRSSWVLTSIRSCHFHQCMLVDLSYAGAPSDGDDFLLKLTTRRTEQGEMVIEPVKMCDLELERYLLRRIRGAKGPEWLDTLQFHVAAQLCENFGLLLTKGAEAVRHQTTEREWVEAGAAGYRVLRNGKDALTGKLKEIQNRNPIEYQLYRSKYRVFYQWLRDRDEGPEFDEIRDHVRQFVFNNFPVKPGALVLGVPCTEQKLHTICTASRRYGISRQMLSRCLVERGLAQPVVGSTTPKIHAYIQNAVVEDIVFDTIGTMDIGQAAQYLGINRNLMARFIGRGWIRHLVKPGTDWPRFTDIHLKRFIADLWKKPKDRLAVETLTDIPTAAHRTRCRIEHIVELILENRLGSSRRASSETLFKSVGVDLHELRELLVPPHDIGFSVSAAVEKLRVSTSTITNLIDAGVLKSEVFTWPIEGRTVELVTAQSVAEFRSKHISLAELSDTKKRAPGPLAQHLAAKNILPATLLGGGSRIYRRADLTSI
ncbi:TniQ family protein [Aliiroseovarius crassostreae]|uniref:TniQ family protein n=1 Tax=Aliiroseovarius crassostreae TaxID=154981 RepID=UPI003C7D5E75